MKEGTPQSDEELLELVCTVSLRDFNLPFRHSCRYNSRLRTSSGRYLLSTHALEFNPHSVRLYGLPELIGTIRHELCHYHLHLHGRGYRHCDREFQDLLKRVGGSRYARPTGMQRELAVRLEYACSHCGRLYRRRRRIDTKKYVCGDCRGQLLLVREERKNNKESVPEEGL